MRRNIKDYRLYVFDLDGTLYDQPKLRLIMAMRLMLYYMCHPFSVKELLILQHFRKVKDTWTGSSSEEEIYKRVADDKKTSPDKVAGIVKKWIYDNPLSALKSASDEHLAKWIAYLRKEGKKVVVLSDYPTKDKLNALGITVDGQYGPDDERLSELKPSPKGLQIIMQDTGISAEDILMIGDRDEKDGASARAAGVDSLILKRRINKRNYNEIGI